MFLGVYGQRTAREVGRVGKQSWLVVASSVHQATFLANQNVKYCASDAQVGIVAEWTPQGWKLWDGSLEADMPYKHYAVFRDPSIDDVVACFDDSVIA